MDAIRIQVIRGCDAQGEGGTVVDDATGVMGTMGNGTPLMDVVIAAFQDAYGLTYDNPLFDPNLLESESNPRTVTVSPVRNVSTRWRLFSTEIVTAYAAKVAAEQAAAAARQQAAAAIQNLSVVENL